MGYHGLEVNKLTTIINSNGKIIKPVDNVSFKIRKNEVVGLVGESGCGKSMTAMSIVKLMPKGIATVDSGEVIFNGENILNYRLKELNKIRGKEISFVFQEPMTALNPVYTVYNQIKEILDNHFKLNKKETKYRIIKLLNEVGLDESVARKYPHELSGGMRQRVVIAMAIACKPKLIIADEPTTALDVTTQSVILKLLKRLIKEYGMSLLFITHDLGVVKEICEKVIVMYAGQVIEEGDVNNFFKNPSHPYSTGLLESLPENAEKNEDLKYIKGNVPNLDSLPVGCRFSDRCPVAMDICFKKEPVFYELNKNQKSRCWLYDE